MDNSNHPSNHPSKDAGDSGKKGSSWEYKKRAIQSATPLRLVIMLYEEAITSLEESKQYISDFKTYDVFNQKLFKAIDIIKELRLSLDMGQGMIPEKLDALYEYMGRILLESGLKKQTEPIDESIKILEELLSSWKEIETKSLTEDPQDAKNQSKSFPSRFDGGFSIKG